MIIAQINLYLFIYNPIKKDFDIISINKERLEIPNIEIIDSKNSIKNYLDSIRDNITIDCKLKYRLYNNIIIENTLHCIYFSVIPDNSKLKDGIFRLPIKDYAIHSPNIQQIMQIIK